jgi:hypothetical protein
MNTNRKPVSGFEGVYSVSPDGVVVNERTGRRVHGTVYSRGYIVISLSNKGSVERRFLHSIVAQAYIGERPAGFHVDHIDGDRKNNTASNLRYLSPAANARATVERGAQAVGERNGQAKLTSQQVAEILEAQSKSGRYYGRNQLAKKFGVSASQVSRVARGLAWDQCATAIRALAKEKA